MVLLGEPGPVLPPSPSVAAVATLTGAVSVVIGLLVGDVGSTVRAGADICLRSGLLLGPVIGLPGGAGTAWLRFSYARLWLLVHGLAPWRVTELLEDAHARGVLRQTGAAYQFRHARLQASLAAHCEPADADRTRR